MIYSDAVAGVAGCKDLNVEGVHFNLDPRSHEMNLNYPDVLRRPDNQRHGGGMWEDMHPVCVFMFVFIAVPDTDWIFLATFRIGGPKSQRTVFSDFFAPGKFFSKSVSPK